MPRKPLAALFLIALVAAACSSGNGDSVADGLEGATPTRQSTTVEADPTASSAPTTEPTTPPAGPPAEDALRTWVAMWDGAEQLVTDPTAADEAIGANADPSVAEQLATIFSPDVEGDVDIAARTFENHPVLTDTGDGTVRIDDCLQVTPPDTSPFVYGCGGLPRSSQRPSAGACPLRSPTQPLRGTRRTGMPGSCSGSRRIRIIRSWRRPSLVPSSR